MRIFWLGLGWLLALPAWAGAMVWQVEGLRQPVYIAGSIHLLRAADHPLPREYGHAFARSRALVLELDMEHARGLGAQNRIMALGSQPPGGSLRAQLSGPTRQRLEAHCAQERLPCVAMDSLRAWMFTMALMQLELGRHRIEARHGVDVHFSDRARKQGKPRHALETLDQQIGVLAALEAEGPDALVGSYLDDMGAFTQTFDAMIEAWRRGDEAALDAQMVRPMRERYPAVYRALLVERNQRWAEALDQRFRKGESLLVIVGSAHLVGDDSLIRLLQARGYSLRKLELPARR